MYLIICDQILFLRCHRDIIKRFATAAAQAREILKEMLSLTLYMYQKQEHPIFQANILVHIQDIEEVNNMIKTYAQVMQIFFLKKKN